MAKDKLFKAWINPLAFFEVDEPWARTLSKTPDCKAVLRFICTPGIESNLESLINRYREISKEPKRLFAAPAEERILTKLVWPLRHAKACYMLGNYLGTISLCGMVAEMVVILIFEISNISINSKPLDKVAEVGLFGSRFEKLGQERRVAVLRAYNLIDDDLKSHFDKIREKRRQYLHLYSQDHDQLAPDAIEVFNATVTIVVNVIGQDIRDGKIILKPALLKYLEERGIVKPLEQDGLEETQASESQNKIMKESMGDT